ncbi:hypothetical protein [Cohnella sp. WQ 127256]|uniref:hypothetical protein n=1 Tax=Cohnella sp. WQ 127256 TaxID=2938790 RepID=UPI00211954D1|nr:hypothetical protein [Cohnella sp. WQ 127256]
MNRVLGIVRTHLADRWSWIIFPWLILSISFVTNLIIVKLIGDSIYSGGLASIYIYMMVIGILSVAQTFPFIIGFSVRRRDYFLGTTTTITVISALSAIVICLLGYIERKTDYWGVKLHFFNIEYLTDGPVLERLWILFVLMIHLFFLGFTISCIHRRFGRNGLFFFFIVLAIAFTISVYLITSYHKWNAIFDWFGDISVIELSSGLFICTLIYVGVSYLLLRRATV